MLATGTFEFIPLIGIAINSFFIVLIFMRRTDKFLSIALGLKLIFLVLQGPMGILRGLPVLALLILTFPHMQNMLQKAWMLPPLLSALTIFFGIFDPNVARTLSNLWVCLEFWGYLFLCAWLANPSATFKELFFKDIDTVDSAGGILGALFLKGMATFGPLLAVIGLFVVIKSDAGLSSPIAAPFITVLMPAAGGIGRMFVGLNQGRKNTKEVKRVINEVNARSNIPGVSDRAKAELQKEAAKKAKKEVIKGAVVGGIIAGDAGAVVGAMSVKAGQDASSGGAATDGGKSASKEVIKSAVVGGIIAGDAGAIVGAAAAKAGQDAKNKTDKTT